MNTLYIHIGTPKTGTTAIQNFLDDNKKILTKYDLVYPTFDATYEKVRSVRNGHWLVKKKANPDLYEECMKQLILVTSQSPCTVLTDEGIWNHGGTTERFWKKLKGIFDENDVCIKPIVYLRRQDDYAYSYYSQRVKRLCDLSLDFKGYLNSEDSKNNHLNYAECLDTIASVIGKENLIVRPYEHGQFTGARNDIFSDILLNMGLEWHDEFIITERFNNASMKDSVLEARRLLNSVPEFTEQNPLLKHHLEAIQLELKADGKLKDRTGYSESDRAEFLKTFKEGNEYIAKEYLNRADGKLFYDESAGTNEALDFERSELEYIYSKLCEMNAVDDPAAALYTPEQLKRITETALENFDAEKKASKKFRLFKRAGKA